MLIASAFGRLIKDESNLCLPYFINYKKGGRLKNLICNDKYDTFETTPI